MTTTRSLVLMAVLSSSFCLASQAGDSTHPTQVAPETHKLQVGFKNIKVEEFEKLRGEKGAVILDVRTPREYAAGHMPGAVNINVNGPDFEKKVEELDPAKTYLVHCAAGVRSTKACKKLTQLHFLHLYNLEGGFRAWEAAGNKPTH